MISRHAVNIAATEGLTLWTGRPVTLLKGVTAALDQKLADLFPYAYLEPLSDGFYFEDFANSWSVAEFPYAAISCAQNTASLEQGADRIENAFLHHAPEAIVIPGYKVIGSTPDDGRDTPKEEAASFWSVRQSFKLTVSVN